MTAPSESRPSAGRSTGARRLAERVHRVLLAVLAAGLLVFAAASVPFVHLPVAGSILNDWLSSGLTVLASADVLLRLVVMGRRGRAWIPLAIGMSSYALGTVLWAFWIRHLPGPPFPSVADPLWLAIYPLGYATIVMCVRHGIGKASPSIWLDGLIGALAMTALVGALILPPVLAGAQGNASAIVTSVAYPIGDLLLIAGVVAGCAITGWRLTRMWALLAAGFLAFTVADGLYLTSVIGGSAATETLPNFMWSLGVVLMAQAVWAPRRTASSSAGAGTGRLAAMIPSAWALAAIGLLVLDHFHHLDGISMALAGATIFAVVVRLALSVGEERRLGESQRQALTDELTGLANRRALTSALGTALRVHPAEPCALLLLDLNGFKELNDTLGHDAGDEMLRAIGARLQVTLRDEDLLARLGGDEFAVVVRRCGADDAQVVAHKLIAALHQPIPLMGISVQSGAGIGIACHPEHGTTVTELLKRADVAMYRAKAARTGVESYDGGSDALSTDRLALAGGLGGALARGEITAHYQPQVDPVTSRLVGVEALARWEHPQRGLLLPGAFLTAIEQTNFSRLLTMRMLEIAARDWSRWCRAGLDVPVAVNLAAVNLIDEAFPGDVADVLRTHAMPPARLHLEVTETTVITDPARALRVLGDLRARGIRIALDDFGTEHSSLSHLNTLPIDEIKIDRSFVRDIAHNARTASIVASTVTLARTLGLGCIAEGVEDEATRAALVEVGCDCVQGYLFAAAMPAAELASWSLDHAAVATTREA